MKSKLGIIDRQTLDTIEQKIISTKIELLDYQYTFDETEYNFDFLVKLHKYLFEDLYYLKNDNLRSNIDEFTKQKVNQYMKILTVIGSVNQEELNLIPTIFDKLWLMQLFTDGNSRTLVAFLKIYALF